MLWSELGCDFALVIENEASESILQRVIELVHWPAVPIEYVLDFITAIDDPSVLGSTRHSIDILRRLLRS